MNEVISCLVSRRSCKKYQKTQIDEAQLQEILTAGLYAPSGMGRQSPIFVVLQKEEDIRQLAQMNAAVRGSAGDPFYGAPTVVVVLADAKVPTCVEDGSVAICNMLNAASSLGVGACWIHRARQEFESEAGKALLQKWGIPSHYIGVGHCILGNWEGTIPQPAPRREGRILRV